MEGRVLPKPVVVAELAQFIPVWLHTDGTDANSRKYAELQRQEFGTVALPLYVVVTPDGKEVARLEGLERDPAVFAAFLRRAREKAASGA
jgi:thiol:disulfide interchange protein